MFEVNIFHFRSVRFQSNLYHSVTFLLKLKCNYFISLNLNVGCHRISLPKYFCWVILVAFCQSEIKFMHFDEEEFQLIHLTWSFEVLMREPEC